MTVRAGVRVSTEEQRKYGWSSREQSERIRKWCEDNGYGEPVIYDDSGFQGGDADRPGIKRLEAEVRPGDMAAFTKVDRASRDTAWLMLFLDRMQAKGVAVRFLEMGDMDPFTAVGKRIAGYSVVNAQGERETTSENTIRGIRMAAHEHVHIGRRPWGFDVVVRGSQRFLEPGIETRPLLSMRLTEAADRAGVKPYVILRFRKNVQRWESTKPWMMSTSIDGAKRRQSEAYQRRYREKKRAERALAAALAAVVK